MSKGIDKVAQDELNYMERLYEFTKAINKVNYSAIGGASIREIKISLKKTVPMLQKLVER